MEIAKFKMNNLRNEEHYKFNLDFSGLVTQFTPETLGIQALYPVWQAAFGTEEAALNVVRASAITDELYDTDVARDVTFKGLAGTVKSALNHFDAGVKAAAARLEALLDTYGAVFAKPYDQETAAIIKLVSELEGTYAADVTTMGIAGWVAELKARNQAFDALKSSRYTENTAKPQQNLKLARVETDNAYRPIVKRVNALIEVNGTEAYAGFVAELNQRIANYRLILAQRKGRKAAGEKAPEGAGTPKEDE